VRTTVELDDDVAKALQQLRADRGLGVSEALNELVRRGLLVRPPKPSFRQSTHPLGLRIDVSNVAEALDLLEGPEAR
jgi:hypothetical protein